MKKILKFMKKGFSLAETLVVVTLVGVLSTVLYTNYTKYINTSKQKVVEAEFYEILEQFEIEMVDHSIEYSGTLTEINSYNFRTYDELIKVTDQTIEEIFENISNNSLPAGAAISTVKDKVNNEKTYVVYERMGYTLYYDYINNCITFM